MLSDDEHDRFPIGTEYLDLQQRAFATAAGITAPFTRTSGEKLPATVSGLGTVLSLMYRSACCAWGCHGSDHQLEWLVGRVVNQSNAAYNLILNASYDEALILARGIGEIANLLWLFQAAPEELKTWGAASRRERLNVFGPAGVRKKLEQLYKVGPPIDEKRYQRLCEVGVHPIPGLPPSHFTGTGRPMLSGLVQPVAIYVCTTELAYATTMCATPTAMLIIHRRDARQKLFDASVRLVNSIGSFTIMNYEDLLEKALRGQSSGDHSVR